MRKVWIIQDHPLIGSYTILLIPLHTAAVVNANTHQRLKGIEDVEWSGTADVDRHLQLIFFMSLT